MLEIRVANEKDLSNIVQLYDKIWRQKNREAARRLGESPDPDLPRARQLWGKYLNSPNKGLHVAYDGEQFLGYASYHKDVSPVDTYALSTMYVADHTRSEEVYKSFIKANATNAKSLGYEEMYIYLDGQDDPLKELITEMGAQYEYSQGMCWSYSETWSWRDLERLK